MCFPTDRAAYGRLCRLLTLGKRRAEKGDCDLTLAELLQAHAAEGQVFCRPAAVDDPGRRLTPGRPSALNLRA